MRTMGHPSNIPAGGGMGRMGRRNRDSLISLDSTTIYASSFSDISSSSVSAATESTILPTPPVPSRTVPSMYDDPPTRTTPTRSAPASRQQTPQRSAVIRHQPSRSEVREIRDPALSATPPRRDNGQIRQMVERLTPDSTTTQRPARPTQGAKVDPSRVTQRPSQAQLRTKQSSARLSEGQAMPRTRAEGDDVQREHPARRQSTQVERPSDTFEGHSYSQANPPNVRTGTSQVAIPRRPAKLAPPRDNKPPVSPAGSHASFAEKWEEELIKRAKTLRIPDVKPPTQQTQVAKHHGDPEIQDWERMGMAHEARLQGREEEDRSRRDAQRQIAYPPQMLSQPIRAVASGVTSVHIGVRPRIHPSRAESCLSMNQPDTSLPEPLFSPLPSAGGVSPSGSTTRSGGEGRYSADKYAQAQKEYEDWLSRKEEREAGIGQPHDSSGGKGDGFGQGSSSWQPRDREPARFGYLYGANEAYPANLGKGSQPTTPGDVEVQPYEQPQIANHAYDPKAQMAQAGQAAPPAQAMQAGMGMNPAMMGMAPSPGTEGQGQDLVQMQQMQDMYGGYGGQWDPATYWWMVQQMQMAQMQQMGYDGMGYMGMMPGNEVSPITSEESSGDSGSSGSETVEQVPKVHFAPSPERNRAKPRRRRSMLGLNVSIASQGAIQQESVTGSPAGYDAAVLAEYAQAQGQGQQHQQQQQQNPGMPHNPYFGHVSGSGMTPMNMMGMNGMGGMGMGMNPYMQMGMHGHGGPSTPMGMPQSPGMSMSGQSIAPPASSGTSGGGGPSVKPYDAALLKAGRMGHYGYLQGRELAGPPPGTLPAGVSANEYTASKYGSTAMSAGASQPPSPSAYGPPQTAYGNGSMGVPMKTGYSRQAGNNGAYAAGNGWYSGSAASMSMADYPGIDGRKGKSHRRVREGRV